jgi:hypothetical protein
VGAVNSRVPHLRIVVSMCLAAIAGYSVFSAWAVFYSDDAALRGDVIGTWKSFAVLAFGFWLGSSSAGKARDGDPQPVSVVNPPDKPVPTTDSPPEPGPLEDGR